MNFRTISCVCWVIAWGLAGTVDAAGVYEDIDGLVVMEAENFAGSAGRTDPQKYVWRVGTVTPGFAGSGYIDTPYATGTNATWANGCEVTYRFTVAQDATYAIWLRRYAPYGWNDSCFVGLDGVQLGNEDNTANYAQWIWVERGTMDVTAGSHAFSLRRLESGYMVDRIVLARTDGYTPVNEGPAETLVVYSPIDPDPVDGAIDVARDLGLSWTPGQFAVAHDVYLGTSFDDVSAAGRTDPRGVLVRRDVDANRYDPGDPLEYGRTYYWRVDDVAVASGATIHKGEVWSFATELYAYSVEHVAVAVSGAHEIDSGPEKMIDGSGLNDLDQHSTDTTTMWLTAFGESAPVLEYDFGSVRKLHEMQVWNYNADVEPVLGFGLKDLTIEYSTNNTDRTALGQFELAWALGLPNYTRDTTIDFGGVPVRYVRMTVLSNWGGLPQYGLSEVRFLCVPVHARKPQPADGATDVVADPLLSWLPGRGAVEHQVYLATDEQTVIAGTAPVDTVAQSTYTPGPLDLATMYFWTVVEVNDAATIPTWPTDVWRFTTSSLLALDDFESYTNESPNRVFQTWVDGIGFSPDEFFPNGEAGNGTAALVGYDPLAGDIMEQTLVHDGRQSMPLAYDNTNAVCSETTCTFGTPQDWSARGIKTLVLYFRGATTNTAGRLYVKINDAVVPYEGDAADIARTQWTPWRINLALVSTNLQQVRKLTIGVDDGGLGLLYIDDLQLTSATP